MSILFAFVYSFAYVPLSPLLLINLLSLYAVAIHFLLRCGVLGCNIVDIALADSYKHMQLFTIIKSRSSSTGNARTFFMELH